MALAIAFSFYPSSPSDPSRAGKRPEQLARIEALVVAGHCLGFVPVTFARPARSSTATAFQLTASANRSDIGRRRASITASGLASGSRTEAATCGSVG
jgi:hypothetical protein